jgi:hypothetical protein
LMNVELHELRACAHKNPAGEAPFHTMILNNKRCWS